MSYRMLLSLVTLLGMTLLDPSTRAVAQLPNPALDVIFPAGGQAGRVVNVQVDGRDLDEGRQLVFSHAGIVGRPVMRAAAEFEIGPQTVPNQFEVSISLNVPPGTYDARLLGRFGVSTPRSFVVGDVPERREAGDHHSPEAASDLAPDVVVNGHTDAGAVDYFRFHAQQGQTLVIECMAQHLGASLSPVLTIWDHQHRRLARSRHLLDPRLEFVAPDTGDYLLSVRDHLYAGGAKHLYRLRVCAGPYLVAVTPIAAIPGANAALTAYGHNLPQGQTDKDIRLNGVSLQRAPITLFVPPRHTASTPLIDPITATPDGFIFRWPTHRGVSNGLMVSYADHDVVTEVEANDTPDTAQPITIPCDFSGRFYPRRDQDWVQFSATKGQAYQIRVLSHRLGHPTDPEIFVQKVVTTADGKTHAKQVLTNDDSKTDAKRYRQAWRRGLELSHRDPVVRFTADQDADYRIGMRDLNVSSIDDPRFAYRLVIEPQQPDFRLIAWTQQQAMDDDKKIDRASMVLRRSGTLPVLIDVLSQGGFRQDVRVYARGLPTGVTASECHIAAGRSEGVLMLTARDDATTWCGSIEVVGEANVGANTIERVAQEVVLTGSTINVEQSRPAARLARQTYLAVLGQESAFARVRVTENDSTQSGRWKTHVGEKIAIPLSYEKHAKLKGDCELSLIGLPDKVKAQPVKLKPDSSTAELQLALDNDEIQPGTYTLFLRGKLKADYARNPQAIVDAQARRDQFNEVIAQIDQLVAMAAEQLAQAQRAASVQTEQLTQNERQTAQAAVAKAEAHHNQRVEKRKRADAFAKQLDERLAAAKKNFGPTEVTSYINSPAIVLEITASETRKE